METANDGDFNLGIMGCILNPSFTRANCACRIMLDIGLVRRFILQLPCERKQQKRIPNPSCMKREVSQLPSLGAVAHRINPPLMFLLRLRVKPVMQNAMMFLLRLQSRFKPVMQNAMILADAMMQWITAMWNIPFSPISAFKGDYSWKVFLREREYIFDWL